MIVLMAIGWRQGWDPRPAELPPRTLRTAREELDAERVPVPRWFGPVLAAGAALPPLALVVDGVFDVPWVGPWMIVVSPFVVWAAGQAVAMIGATDTRKRVAVVVRAVALTLAVAGSAVTGSP